MHHANIAFIILYVGSSVYFCHSRDRLHHLKEKRVENHTDDNTTETETEIANKAFCGHRHMKMQKGEDAECLHKKEQHILGGIPIFLSSCYRS
jgi:hypothetical protein